MTWKIATVASGDLAMTLHMKIAFFHELSFGGARRVVEEYGKILSINHIVDLYYLDVTEDLPSEKIFNKTFFFPENQKKHRIYNDTVSLFRLSIIHKKIADLIDNGGYDFVFVHPSKFTQAPFILRFLKTPSVYYCQEPLRIVYDPLLKQLPNTSLTKRMYELLNRSIRKALDYTNTEKAGLILANSQYSADWIADAYGKKASICYLGVDPKQFVQQKTKKEYDILFLGQPIDVEGYDLLEGAMEFFDKKPVVQIISRDLQGKGIPDKELVNEYNKSKIVVCLSRNEPFGLTAIEAMACSVPVVAVNEGGYKESVLDGKTGFLVERNQEKLFEKLDELISNEKRRNEMGENARKNVLKQWAWEKSVDRFLEIITTWQKSL